MMWITIVFATILSIYLKKVDADLTVVPKDTVVKVGEATFLNCSTDLLSKQVHWLHGGDFVYTGGPVLDPYSSRFQIQNSSGVFNLFISEVETGDAGKYTCQDDGGHGQKSSAELIVIESDPVCPNNCFLELESGQLNCSLSYGGNIPPQIVWKRQRDNTNITKGVTMSSNGTTVSYTLAINASDLRNNEQPFFCETTQATSIQYKCSTPDFKTSCTTEITVLDTSPEDSLSSIWVIIVVLVAIGIVAALVVAVLCFIKRRRMNEDPIENGRTKEMQPLNSNSGDDIIKENQGKGNDEMPTKLSIEESNQLTPSKKDVVDEEKVGKEGDEKRTTDPIYENASDTDIGPAISNNIPSTQIDETTKWNISNGKEIRGIAVGDDKIFVLTYDQIFLELFNLTGACGVRSLNEHVSDPRDISYCRKNEQLYVLDGALVQSKSKGIAVLNTVGNYVKSWKIDKDSGSLSVASDGNIILTSPESIEEYSPDGKQIRRIGVHETVIPLCAIKMNDHKFLVSRGQRNGDVFEVCLINISDNPTTGNNYSVKEIEKSFGKSDGLKFARLNNPRSLVVHENEGIFVLDEKNNRVVILNSNLTFREEIFLHEHGLQSPVKLCLNGSQLIVAGNSILQKDSAKRLPGVLTLTLRRNSKRE